MSSGIDFSMNDLPTNDAPPPHTPEKGKFNIPLVHMVQIEIQTDTRLLNLNSHVDHLLVFYCFIVLLFYCFMTTSLTV